MNRGSDGRWALVLVLLFLVGWTGHVVAETRPVMLALTPVFLLVTGVVSLVLAWPSERRIRFVLWIAVAYAITLAAEIVGVATGLVFGAYYYGPTLGPALGGVPLIIGFNWVLVVLACTSLFTGLKAWRWWAPPVAALVATGFDAILEPIAMKYDYWQWVSGEIPLQNYLAWFVLALVVALSWCWLGVRLRARSVQLLVLAQALFFAGLRLA